MKKEAKKFIMYSKKKHFSGLFQKTSRHIRLERYNLPLYFIDLNDLSSLITGVVCKLEE